MELTTRASRDERRRAAVCAAPRGVGALSRLAHGHLKAEKATCAIACCPGSSQSLWQGCLQNPSAGDARRHAVLSSASIFAWAWRAPPPSKPPLAPRHDGGDQGMRRRRHRAAHRRDREEVLRVAVGCRTRYGMGAPTRGARADQSSSMNAWRFKKRPPFSLACLTHGLHRNASRLFAAVRANPPEARNLRQSQPMSARPSAPMNGARAIPFPPPLKD